MNDDLEIFQVELEQSVELQRRKVVTKIAMESESLVDQLLVIIYNNDLAEDGRPVVDAKVKLSAIAMLLDRGVPKLAVDSTKSEVVEETGTRKKIREEIELLMKKQGIV